MRVRFAAEVARYVQEKRWHASQKLTPQPDRSVIAEFELRAMEEVKAWILSFGSNAEVLEPALLREEIRNELMAALAEYDEQKDSEETSPTPSSRSRLRRRAR